ncbi:MAG TPA: hypothetical protein VJ464_03370 [Blastocatellia bacterium]|nr:hypothetical protein [Blastocatellia bacterium]
MKRVLLSVMAGLLLFGNSQGQVNDSKEVILESPTLLLYYNINGVTKTKGNTVKIWLKVVPKSKKFKDEYEKSRKKNWPKHHAPYIFTLVLQEYDCEGMVRYLDGVDYGENHEKIGRIRPTSLAEIAWRNIIPENNEDKISKDVCKVLEK